MRFGFSQRMRIAVALILGTIVFTACGNDSGKYFGERATPNDPRAVPIAQARREALTLLVYLYDVLTKEFGVGEWSRFEGGEQIHDEPLDCPDGYAAESYSLGAAAPLGKDKWEAAVKRIYEILKPYGFEPPQKDPNADEGRSVTFYNPNTAAEISLGFEKSTALQVGSGCAKGTQLFENWPEGAEVVPQRLRGSGRALYTMDHEIWPDQAPDPKTPPTPPPPPQQQTKPSTPPSHKHTQK